MKMIEPDQIATTPSRPNVMDVIGKDRSAVNSSMTPFEKPEIGSPKFDLGLLKSCIKRIHVLDKT